MEAKSFFSKSSNIFSVAILVAGLSTFGAGIYTSETNAKDMQKQMNNMQVKMHKQQLLDESKIKSLQDSLNQEKANNGILNSQLQEKGNQVNDLLKQNDDLKKQVVSYQTRNESPSPSSQRTVNVVATAYTNSCTGCTGITATGINVKNTNTYEGAVVVATDPSVIPTHSVLRISTDRGQTFTAIAEDKGGAIHGHIVDVLVPSYNEAINFGRQNATITIIKEGA